ncbi:MAG: SpoIID/LytB domain-containing protein [Acidobacteriota bacterium]
MLHVFYRQVAWLALLVILGTPLTTAGQVTRPRRVSVSLEMVADVAEPEIRIALATNADFATLTCEGPMVCYGEEQVRDALPITAGKATVQLEVGPGWEQARGRYRVEVASFKSRQAATAASARLREQVAGPVTTRYDAGTQTYAVVVGDCAAPEDAEALMVSVVNAGFRHPIVTRDVAPNSSRPRLGVTAGGGDILLRGAQRCTFIALEEERTPLKLSGQSYRGRIEVFLNRRGRLTVVNAVPLEAYLRGVVPNELSPTVFAHLEALKAQAIAARTYALKNRGKYAAEGYDLLPTAASQVYRGQGSEHPLSDRAVLETRGLVLTYNGEPIDALYTSTSGGRTESSEYVFGTPYPYLKGVLVTPVPQTRARRWVTSSRDVRRWQVPELQLLARDWALLRVVGFALPERPSVAYFTAPVTAREVTLWLNRAARLVSSGQNERQTGTVLRLEGFVLALMEALHGRESPARLVTPEDARYWLGAEAEQFSPEAQPALAYLVRENILRPTALLTNTRPLTRGLVLSVLARSLLARGISVLQSGTARPYDGTVLTVRSGKGKDEQRWKVAPDAYLFRTFGGECLPVERVEIIGGETVRLCADQTGWVRYLEVTPVLNGATGDRTSPFSWWEVRFSPAELQSQLAKAGVNVGAIRELRPLARGESGRIARLQVIGTAGTSILAGLKIRSALGVRENLFVILHEQDTTGRLTGVRLIGRGWGHGVGMCQVGAYGLAVEGYTYEQILKHFYTGIALTRLYR